MNIEQEKIKALIAFNDRIEKSINQFREAEDGLIDDPDNRFLKLRKHQSILLMQSDAAEIVKICAGFYGEASALNDLLLQEKLS